jgi:hypothetical protein
MPLLLRVQFNKVIVVSLAVLIDEVSRHIVFQKHHQF